MANTLATTLTGHRLIDYARSQGGRPVLGVAGYDQEPALSFINEIVQRIMNKDNPWKWNSYPFPPFFTQPYQQDYATSISQNTIGWLESCTMIQQNTNDQPPPQPPVRAVARILPTSSCGNPTEICWIANRNGQFGQWPGNSVFYQNPLNALGGGPGSNLFTSIVDPNGNIQNLTQYGTTMASGTPAWPAANAQAGTQTQDGSVVWTVQDPNGVALRVNFLATYGSVVWQLLPFYQQKPPIIKSLGQTLDPIPYDLEYLVRQGFLLFCTRNKKTFASEMAQWMEDVKEAMEASDREPQEFGMYPAEPITGAPNPGSFTYPGWPGWTNSGV
jgi:hypothetical protein